MLTTPLSTNGDCSRTVPVTLKRMMSPGVVSAMASRSVHLLMVQMPLPSSASVLTIWMACACYAGKGCVARICDPYYRDCGTCASVSCGEMDSDRHD